MGASKRENFERRVKGTGEVPWLALVEVDIGDGGVGERGVLDLPREVAHDQLLVRGMEAEAGREPMVGIVGRTKRRRRR